MMLTLSRMNAMFKTTDGEGRTPLVEPILARWEHDPGSARWMRASSNFVCLFTCGGQARYLRFGLDEGGPFLRHSPLVVEAELAFVGYLRERGLYAAQPVPSKAGREVEAVDTPLGTMSAAVFEGLSGESFDFDELPPERYLAWGRAVGAYHNAAEGYDRPGRPDWRAHLGQVEAALDTGDDLARAALARLLVKLDQLPVTRENYGLIHYDLCADNLFWQEGGAVGYIDFDDCCYSWFAADLAYAARDIFDDCAVNFDATHPPFAVLLEGYRQVRPLADEEVARLPLFLIQSHLLNYAELTQIVSEVLEPGEPGWVSGLREKLKRKNAGYRAAFLHFLKS